MSQSGAVVLSQDTQFKLEANGMRCACLSGDMGKEARQRVLHSFRCRCCYPADMSYLPCTQQ